VAQLPTVDDVARVANVSRQTVSNVINTPAIVKESTRTRVEEVISTLGYRPHASARRLRSQKSFTLGIRLEPVRNGISGSVLDTFLHALTEQADERGMRILLYTADDPVNEIEQIRRLRDGADIDAFVLTSTAHDDPRIGWLVANHVPFATFGRPWGIDDMNDPTHLWVDVDGRAGVRAATEHLLDDGAQSVGYIGWPSPSGAGDDRRLGWSDAMSAAGKPIDGLAISTVDGVSQGSAAATLLLGADRPPQAIVCASDSLALGALMAATALGKADMPVVGFDNTPVADAVGLSSIEQPLAAVAAGVLELLFGATGSTILDRRTANEEPRHRLLAPRLVVRRSRHLALGGTTGTASAGNHNRKESL
jgi:DNA-binding LacI/PurR family transcriptional regulator